MKLLHNFTVRLSVGTGLPWADCCEPGEMYSVCFPSSLCSKDTHKTHHFNSLLISESYSKPLSCFCFGLKQDQKKPSINLFPVTLHWIALPVLHLILKLHFIYGWPTTTQASPLIPLPSGTQWNLDNYSLPSTALTWGLHVSPKHATHPPFKNSTKRETTPFKSKPQFQIVNLLPLILKSIFLGQWRDTTSSKPLNDFGPRLNTTWRSQL